MKSKKLLSVLLAVIFCVTTSLPAFAADNSDVDAKIAALEQKYDIRIQYDTNANGSACIGTGALATLDSMLSIVTPAVVKEVSAYINTTLGRKLTYHYTYAYNLDIVLEDYEEALGAFNTRTGVIELYIPAGRSAYSSGDGPITIVHEFGHALHGMLEAKYGAEALEAQWTSMNGSNRYKGYFGDGSYVDTTFFSEYASTEYGEDFAETFAHAVTRNRAGLGFSYLLNKDGYRTNLGNKVDYLCTIISQGLVNGAGLAANIKYNANNTPIYANYQGLQLYGVKLQYIGCAWPSYVLNSIMSDIGEGVQSYQWIYELGGWYTQGSSGTLYLIFPGGYAQVLKTPLQAATAA